MDAEVGKQLGAPTNTSNEQQADGAIQLRRVAEKGRTLRTVQQ